MVWQNSRKGDGKMADPKKETPTKSGLVFVWVEKLPKLQMWVSKCAALMLCETCSKSLDLDSELRWANAGSMLSQRYTTGPLLANIGPMSHAIWALIFC